LTDAKTFESKRSNGQQEKRNKRRTGGSAFAPLGIAFRPYAVNYRELSSHVKAIPRETKAHLPKPAVHPRLQTQRMESSGKREGGLREGKWGNIFAIGQDAKFLCRQKCGAAKSTGLLYLKNYVMPFGGNIFPVKK